MIRGSCLCAAVRYEIEGGPLSITHCHCRMCRKGHGAAFASYAEADPRKLRVTQGEEAIAKYRSSAKAQRSFCRHCGANLFFEPEGEPNEIWVAAGGIDSETQLRAIAHIFVDSKAEWDEIRDGLPQHAADSE